MGNFRQIEIYKDGIWQELQLSSYRGGAQLDSPLFRKNTVPGYFSFPLDISYEENAKCLGYPATFTQSNLQREFVAREKLFGGTWCCGRIKILKANKKRLRIIFQDNQGLFKDKIKGVSLREICDEAYSIPCGENLSCETWELSGYFYEEFPAGSELVFTINSNTYTFTNLPETAADLLLLLQSALGNDPDVTVQNILTISDSSATIKICKSGLLGVSFSTNTPDSIFTLISTSTETIGESTCVAQHVTEWMSQPGELSHYFFPIYAPNAYDGENPGWNGWINYYTGNMWPSNLTGTVEFQTRYAYAPQVSYKWVLKCIENFTGFKFKGDIIEDECFCKLTIKNNKLLDKFREETDGSFYNIFEPNYNLKDAIPDLTIEDFLKTLQVFGEFKFDKFDNCITIVNKSEIVKRKATKDWRDLQCDEGDACLPAKEGYHVKYNNIANEPKTDPVFDDYVQGNAGQTLPIPFSPLGNYNGNDPNKIGREWLTPCTLGIASTEGFDVGENDCGFRLMFYHGWHEDSDGNLYPLASSCNVNYNGDQLCEWDLKLNGSDGIVEKFQKAWLDAIDNNSKVISNVLPDAKNIAQFDYCEPVWLEINCIRVCVLIERFDLRYDECGFINSSKIKALEI